MKTDWAYSRRSFLGVAGAAAVGIASPASPTSKVPVIDCHTHAGTAGRLMDPWTTIADPGEILRRNKEARIDQACIFPISHDNFEEANQEIARIVKRYPCRFIGFAKHDPVAEKGRIRSMLLRECRQLGLRGLKLHVTPTPEVLDTVAELGIPILWHPGRVALFAPVAEAYPTIDLILAHLGSDLSSDWREHMAGIEMARRYPNVYLDTGGTVLTRYLEQAAQELGPGKIIYGSDEPEVDCRLEIFKVRMLGLPAEQEASILGGNMQRLLSKYNGNAA
ncbi:MAG TPA: amidohydrolase family protein [Bryobacteraceae bacterium]|nr:amidohydrolase family protein [Bryobacteraceae bacterium]